MAIIKTAILQTHVYTDKFRNITQAAELLASPELQGIDLAALPEMFCCPYENKYFPEYAEIEGGDTWEKCSRLAAEHGIYLVAGSMPERDEAGNIYNTSYVFDRNGHQIGKHRKMHLFDIDVKGGQYFKESDTLTPGDVYKRQHNFFVFFNAETEQVNVVYKRKGNTYGLIEPEF